MDDRVTVFLLDDHEIVRRGLRDLLDAEPDLVVIGEASTEDEALRRIQALDPDVRHGCFCAHPYLLRLLALNADEVTRDPTAANSMDGLDWARSGRDGT